MKAAILLNESCRYHLNISFNCLINPFIIFNVRHVRIGLKNKLNDIIWWKKWKSYEICYR